MPESDIKPIGSDALKMHGPNERSWQGIKLCHPGNHKPWPAFYTSSVLDGGYSQWTKFILGLDSYYCRWISSRILLFDLQMEEHEIYVVNDFDDYEILASEYLTKEAEYVDTMYASYFAGKEQKTFDWVQMALDGIDGVWIRDPHCHPLMYHMDVEQCIWLHMPKFSVVNKVVVPSERL